MYAERNIHALFIFLIMKVWLILLDSK
jgi:hypothetical protein